VRSAVWWALIAGALAAIVAGYVQGITSTQPPPFATLRATARETPHLPPALRALVRAPAGGAVNDLFTQDDVVVERPRASGDNWREEQLAIVIGLCGQSVVADSRFLTLGVPLAFVVDPHAAQAAAFAKLVRNGGQTLFVQTASAPSAGTLAALHRIIGSFDGIASRSADGMAIALRGTGLMFFDERGDADERPFAAAGVPLVLRDVTADDRSSTGYVAFMLSRAAGLSRRVGTVVVLLRPLPSSLDALRAFGSSHNVTIAALR
jgi:polysaccharide deacetylase 2 family uncharacterized protein YibQ